MEIIAAFLLGGIVTLVSALFGAYLSGISAHSAAQDKPCKPEQSKPEPIAEDDPDRAEKELEVLKQWANVFNYSGGGK